MSTPIAVDHVSATHVAARPARAVTTAIGPPEPLPDRAAVVASELAGNLDKHAWDGTVYIQPMGTPPPAHSASGWARSAE